MKYALAILACALLTASASAGLYTSQETFAELPSQWRGFLMDQRSLRQIASPIDPSPLRLQFLEAVKTADDIGELGGLLIRLGKVDQAIETLRAGAAKHSNHFAIAANLGTAWQLKGNYTAAAESLRNSVRLAPGRWLAAEELHLRLVLARMKQKQPGNELDDLFGIRYVLSDDADLPAMVREQITPRRVGLVQQLALWLPADGPLLWQLAEMANALGDVRTAANLMEGCVVQFGMTNPDLRRRRLLAKAAVEKLPAASEKIGHQPGHLGSLTFRSRRPLVSEFDESVLPPISVNGVNPVPWDVLTSTTFEGKFPPRFGRYLKELDGKTVSLNGFLQPLREDGSAYLLIESPVGCWYCEMPEMTGILRLDPGADSPITYERGLRRVVGWLALNATDPEDFLFTLHDAKVTPVD